MLLGDILTGFAFLSLLGSLLVLIYLVATERKAPRFEKSINGIRRNETELLVSIIIPARNEGETIGLCLNSLILQSYKNLEIIVIDDSSSDDTESVVRKMAETDTRIKIFEAGEKPQGWVGKSWPCWLGFEASRGKYLLFLDADSRLSPEALGTSLNYALQKKIDMLSLAPKVEMPSFISRAVMPIISAAINLLYPMQKVNDPKSNRAYVFGTFVLVARKTYEEMGGHNKVRAELVEDAAIAREAKTTGYHIRIERGPEFISTRWESSPVDIYNGLERIMSASVRSYGLISATNALIVFFLSLYPILFVAVYFAAHSTALVLSAGLIFSLLSILSFLILAAIETFEISGRITISGLLYPVGCSFFIAAILSTTIKVSRQREIKWKDSGYYVNPMIPSSEQLK
jgi:chlorobactene glucosyltransferase